MRAFLTALQFQTRLHIHDIPDLCAEDFGRSTRYFPLVGLVLGVLACLCVGLAYHFFGDTYFVRCLLVLVPIALTGGLHWDGFCDTLDGVGSCRERERMLAIMHDSRVGSYGLLAVVALLLVQGSMFLSVPAVWAGLALLLLPVVGRWGMVLVIARFPYTRPEGMGRAFADMADRRTVAVATLTTFVVALPLGPGAWLALLLGGATAWLTGRYLTSLLGGLTGDTYGCIELLTETAALFSLMLYAAENPQPGWSLWL